MENLTKKELIALYLEALKQIEALSGKREVSEIEINRNTVLVFADGELTTLNLN